MQQNEIGSSAHDLVSDLDIVATQPHGQDCILTFGAIPKREYTAILIYNQSRLEKEGKESCKS